MSKYFCIFIVHLLAIIQVVAFYHYTFIVPEEAKSYLYGIGSLICVYIAGIVRGL